MKQIFDLNCRLQVEQVDSNNHDSDDSLALSSRSLRFQLQRLSIYTELLLFYRSCASCSQGSVGILKSFGFKGVFVAFLLTTSPEILHRKLSLVVAHRPNLKDGQSISAVPGIIECKTRHTLKLYGPKKRMP